MTSHTKMDEFLEKFQTAFDPPSHFRKIICSLWRDCYIIYDPIPHEMHVLQQFYMVISWKNIPLKDPVVSFSCKRSKICNISFWIGNECSTKMTTSPQKDWSLRVEAEQIEFLTNLPEWNTFLHLRLCNFMHLRSIPKNTFIGEKYKISFQLEKESE